MRLDHVNIEPTNKCQLNCKWCGDEKTRKVGEMSLDQCGKILDQVKSVNPNCEIRFFLSGEPLLHPQIDDFCMLARAKGFNRILIHTNGVALTGKLAKKLVKNGPTHISFSIDGRTEREYNDIRGPHFDGVLNNVFYYLLTLNNAHTDTKATIQTIIPYPEEKKIPKHFDCFKMFPGLDFHVRWPHNWDVDDSVEESQPELFTPPCGFLVDSLSLTWSGDCTVCCADLNGKYVLGNIFQGGIKKLIKRRDELAERQRKGLSVPVCDGCERYETTRKNAE